MNLMFNLRKKFIISFCASTTLKFWESIEFMIFSTQPCGLWFGISGFFMLGSSVILQFLSSQPFSSTSSRTDMPQSLSASSFTPSWSMIGRITFPGSRIVPPCSDILFLMKNSVSVFFVIIYITVCFFFCFFFRLIILLLCINYSVINSVITAPCFISVSLRDFT